MDYSKKYQKYKQNYFELKKQYELKQKGGFVDEKAEFDYLARRLHPHYSLEQIMEGVAGWHSFLDPRINIPFGVIRAYWDEIIAPQNKVIMELQYRIQQLNTRIATRTAAAAAAAAAAGTSEDEEELVETELQLDAANQRLKKDQGLFYRLLHKYETKNPDHAHGYH